MTRGEGSEASAQRRCRNCGRSLEAASEVGWECECGVLVCSEPECFDEFFKAVAGGEATRCRSCGLVV